MIQLYQKVNTLQVLSFFFREPFEGFYLRELARKIDMDPMTVKRALDLLVRDGYIIRYSEKNNILYKASLEEPHFTFAKVSYNLGLIRESGLVEDVLKKNEGVVCIVLYGSTAKGDDGPKSDIDILVVSASKWFPPGRRSIMEREINISFMTPGQWSRQYSNNKAFYLEVLRWGIELYGKLPVME